MRVTVEIPERDVPLLEVLGMVASVPGEDRGPAAVAAVLGHLAHSAADGVRRPGAWERDWIIQAFGDEFTARVEPDPTVVSHVRPIAGSAP